MKKLSALLLSLILAIGTLTACGNSSNEPLTAELIDIEPMSVLCESGEDGNRFSTSLEDMKENEYTFTF